MDTEGEPVRVSGWIALAVGIALNAVLGWALDLDLKSIVAVVSTMGLTSIGGLEFARARVTPESRVLIREQLARATAHDHD